jgi:hypothetical protein
MTATAISRPTPGSGGGTRPTSTKLTTMAWTPPEELDQRTWVEAGRRLGALGRVSNWLIGDWVREGVARWGERYVAASRITGFDPHSLRNMAYVASRFDLSLRRDNLTWSHHALIAAHDREAQIYWLDFAAEHRLSVADLRAELRSSERGDRRTREPPSTDGGGTSDPGVVSADRLLCPHCGGQISLDELSTTREQGPDDHQATG